MSVESTELKIYIDNDYQLYSGQRKSIEDNLLRKKNAGKYDHAKAVKLWGYLAESGAKKYAREFGGTWNRIFSPADRRQVAKELADDFEAAWKMGEYRERQEALKTKAQRADRSGTGYRGTGWGPKKPKFKLGEKVYIMDGGRAIDEGEVSFVSGYDDELGQYRYKVQTATSRMTYNENSLLKKKRKPARRKRASTCGTSGGKCTKAEVEKLFKTTVLPTIIETEYDGIPDRPMRREAWNNWIDGLARDGTITQKQADTWGRPKWLETYGAKRGRR